MRARWSNLLHLCYDAPEPLVRAALPAGLEPDLWQGQPQVALVAYESQDTGIRGRRVPGVINFPVISLRLYARRGGEPGVVPVRDLVPRRLAAALARLQYGQPAHVASVACHVTTTADALVVEYLWSGGSRQHLARVHATQAAQPPAPGSAAAHFTALRLVFGQRRGAPVTVRVDHPPWAVREIRDCDIRVAFSELYGPEWGFLDATAPHTVVLAVGSPVEIYAPR